MNTIKKPRVVVEEELIKYVKYTYTINDYCLHKHANIQIAFYDKLGNVVYFHNKKIEGPVFKAWGADDTYIDNLVKKEVEQII